MMQLTTDQGSPDPQSTAALRKKLKAWFSQNARKLPWRETHDAYAIWVSEIMLQQTQVATVVDYYHRFLERFPTVSALASAPEQDVLNLWAGLGYYRRARQLHAAAQEVVRHHDGVFPSDPAEILSLPGIGRYTAGAISSFAYDHREPIVEANTSRLYSRLIGLEQPPTLAASQKKLWQLAESLLPARSGAGGVNQALIEVGSLVCKPKQPDCSICPINSFCRAYELGIQNRVPVPKPKPQLEQLLHGMLIIRRKRQFLVRQCDAGQWWEGLWEFPRADLTRLSTSKHSKPNSTIAPDQVAAAFTQQLDLDCHSVQLHCGFKHAVTRYKIQLNCYTAELTSGVQSSQLPGKWRWLSAADSQLPLSAPAQKLRTLLPV